MQSAQYRDLRRRRLMRSLLESWYGEDAARTEVTAYGFRPRPVGAVVEALGREIFSEETMQRIRLENEWETIAGRQLAALTQVAAFRDGELSLEVRHSAFLRELEGIGDLLIPRINRALGGDFCRRIRLAPSGGVRRRPGNPPVQKKN